MRRFLVALVWLAFVAACAGPTADAPTADAGGEPAAATPTGPPEPMDFGPVQMGTAPENPYSTDQVERGAYLVSFGGCNDCHTPWNIDPATGAPAPDMSRMLSGHPRNAPGPQGTPGPADIGLIGPSFTSFKLPIGTVFATNLTPDIDTGSGTWTEEMFMGMFRRARHLGGDGRTILPPMPWPALAGLTDDDLLSIFAYLRSVPPVVNAVPPSEVPQPVLDALAEANDALLEQMNAQR